MTGRKTKDHYSYCMNEQRERIDRKERNGTPKKTNREKKNREMKKREYKNRVNTFPDNKRKRRK